MRAVVLAYCSLGNPKPWISIQAGAKLEILYDLTNMGSHGWFMFAKLVDNYWLQLSVVFWQIYWTSWWELWVINQITTGGHPPSIYVFVSFFFTWKTQTCLNKNFNMLSMADIAASSTRYNVLPCQRLMHVEFIARQVHTRGIANL